MKNKFAETLLQKEDRIELAAEKYFRLFGKDWAEQHHLNETAQAELLEMLKDAYFFMDEMAADAASLHPAAEKTLAQFHECLDA